MAAMLSKSWPKCST